MARSLRGGVLDEVCLVDHHALEAETAEPADVAVENLVVDDDDIGERIEVLTITMQDRRRALRNPALDLTRPVCLHDVRHDNEQGKRVGDVGGHESLGRLAKTRFVSKQERAVTATHRLDESSLVAHELHAAGCHERPRFGKRH